MFTTTNKHWCVHNNNLARTTRAHSGGHSTNIAQSCSQIKFNGGGGGFAQLSRLSIQTVTSLGLDLQICSRRQHCYIILIAFGSVSVSASSSRFGFGFGSISVSVSGSFLLQLLVSQPAARFPGSCVVAALFLWLHLVWRQILSSFSFFNFCSAVAAAAVAVAHMSTSNSVAAVLNSCLVFD